eukprot:PhF_6_TR26075/c0_g1_i4/m.36784
MTRIGISIILVSSCLFLLLHAQTTSPTTATTTSITVTTSDELLTACNNNSLTLIRIAGGVTLEMDSPCSLELDRTLTVLCDSSMNNSIHLRCSATQDFCFEVTRKLDSNEAHFKTIGCNVRGPFVRLEKSDAVNVTIENTTVLGLEGSKRATNSLLSVILGRDYRIETDANMQVTLNNVILGQNVAGSSNSCGVQIVCQGSNSFLTVVIDNLTITDCVGTLNSPLMIGDKKNEDPDKPYIRVNMRNLYFKNTVLVSVASGGAMSLIKVNGSVTNVVAMNTSSLNNKGGALYITDSSTINMTNVYAEGTFAKTGGAIGITSSVVLMNGMTFNGTVSEDDGGAVYLAGSSLGGNNISCNNTKASGGGCFCAQVSWVALTNVSVQGSRVWYAGGAFRFVFNTKAIIDNAIIRRCDGGNTGGAFHVNGSSLQIRNVRVEDCRAQSGSAFAIEDSESNASLFVFATNVAIVNASARQWAGAINVIHMKVWMESVVIRNTQGMVGGVVGTFGSSNVTIRNILVVNSIA